MSDDELYDMTRGFFSGALKESLEENDLDEQIELVNFKLNELHDRLDENLTKLRLKRMLSELQRVKNELAKRGKIL